MSLISVQGEQSSEDEIIGLANLISLSISGSTDVIQKTGPTTFVNTDFATLFVPYVGAINDLDLGTNNFLIGGFSSLGGGNILLDQSGAGLFLIGQTGGVNAVLDINSLTTSDKTFTFPDASGTFALTDDLGGYVPYIGATANLDLGNYFYLGSEFASNTDVQGARLVFINGVGINLGFDIAASSAPGESITMFTNDGGGTGNAGGDFVVTLGDGVVGNADGGKFVFTPGTSQGSGIAGFFNVVGTAQIGTATLPSKNMAALRVYSGFDPDSPNILLYNDFSSIEAYVQVDPDGNLNFSSSVPTAGMQFYSSTASSLILASDNVIGHTQSLTFITGPNIGSGDYSGYIKTTLVNDSPRETKMEFAIFEPSLSDLVIGMKLATGGSAEPYVGVGNKNLFFAKLNPVNLSVDREFLFPDSAGTFALTSDLSSYVPTSRTITVAGTANQITSSAGAQDLSANRTWTLSFPSDVLIPTVLTVPNSGLHILDTNASHDLIVTPGSDLTADRVLTITTGDAARTVTLNGNPTLNDWFDQSVKTTANPQFATIELGHASDTTLSRSSGGVLAVEGVVIPSISSTNTLTNKRITDRVTSVADSATPTPNADTDDAYDLTALAQAATFGAPSGTPTNFQKLWIRIKDNGTARALSWNAAYVAGGVALPTTTVLSKILNLGFVYNTANSLNKWQLVASALEA